jgi:hypothetical protein
MPKVWLRALAISGFVAVLLHLTATITEAQQIDQAYKVNYQNVKRLFPTLVGLAEAEKGRDFMTQSEEFKVNLDLIQNHLERAGGSLHDKERRWLEDETPKNKAIEKCTKLKLATGYVATTLSLLKVPSSEVSNFKSEFNELSVAMEKLWEESQKRGKQIGEYLKEMEERMKLFQAVCRGCS